MRDEATPATHRTRRVTRLPISSGDIEADIESAVPVREAVERYERAVAAEREAYHSIGRLEQQLDQAKAADNTALADAIESGSKDTARNTRPRSSENWSRLAATGRLR